MPKTDKKPPKEPTSCPSGMIFVRRHRRRRINQKGEPYFQEIPNCCRVNPKYFAKFCEEEYPKNPDLIYAVLTIFGEARGQSDEERKVIMYIIMNRLKSKRWGKSFQEVTLKASQLSCWNYDDKNYKKILGAIKKDGKEKEAWEQCKKIVEEVYYSSGENNPLPKICHYFSGKPKQKWQKDYFDVPEFPHFHFVDLGEC